MQSDMIKHDFLNDMGQLLSGRLELPIGKPKAIAVFAHCFTCSKNIKAASTISRALAAEGIGVLRFDFTGLGNSEGDFANTNFSSNVSDLVSAVRSLELNSLTPSILIGHSFGGAAVLKAATRLENIKAVVTIGAPSCASHVKHLFSESLELIRTQKKAEVNLFGRKFTLSQDFIKDLTEAEVLKDVASLKNAFLIMHSPTDNTVSIEHAAKIFHAAKHPKSFVSLDNIDHLLSKESDATYVSRVISAWVKKYIPVDAHVPLNPVYENLVVHAQSGYKFLNKINVGSHQLLIDEPAEVGGNNLGMTPYQYILAALGGCTSMTMKLYAAHKGIEFEDIQVELVHSKIDKNGTKVDHILKKINVTGKNLTDEQKQKLHEIAEKCPVNRTLKSEVIIESIYK